MQRFAGCLKRYSTDADITARLHASVCCANYSIAVDPLFPACRRRCETRKCGGVGLRTAWRAQSRESKASAAMSSDAVRPRQIEHTRIIFGYHIQDRILAHLELLNPTCNNRTILYDKQVVLHSGVEKSTASHSWLFSNRRYTLSQLHAFQVTLLS